MSLQLHRPDGEGGLEPRPVDPDRLARPARVAALGQRAARRTPAQAHENTEMHPTSRFRSVLFWLVLGAATFVILVAGYGSRLWT